MSLRFIRFTILCVLCFIVNGLSVISENKALRHRELNKLNYRAFFIDNEKPTSKYRRIWATRFQKRFSDPKKLGSSRNLDDSSKSRAEAKGHITTQRLLILRRNDTKFASAIEYPKGLSSQKTLTNRTNRNIIVESVQKLNPKSVSVEKRSKTTKTISNMQHESTSARKNPQAEKKRRKKEQIAIVRKSNRISPEQQINHEIYNISQNYAILDQKKYIGARAPFKVSCKTTSPNESSLSLRNLFHVPKVHKLPDCSGRKEITIGDRRREGREQSSAVSTRTFDRGHTELINEYENERSMDIVGVEYVHPEGHVLLSPFATRIIDYPGRSAMRNEENTIHFSTHSDVIGFPFESNLTNPEYRSNNIFSTNLRKAIAPKNYRNIEDTATDENNFRIVHNSSRNKRETYDASIEDRRVLTKATRERHVTSGATVKPAENNRNESRRPAFRKENSTSKLLMNSHNFDEGVTTDTPWPLIPGPISCDLDFQLRPSFVARLGEFDYVVSVQRQQNPEVPPEHACTGVVYNPRFVMIAPHCLHEFCDNYGLTVTSTDDLCTIDEIIEVDYVIEHENYDAETRKNDIALIKLKSEIHKKSATFPKDDGLLGKFFYAVGFGELMWKSYPTKISKLLQKIPVRRHVLKEATGTLDITTSNLDLTGAFRGDFGGVLINPRGELVALKSKLVKKTIEYEVYTRVRTYLPWIESMVAIHGSW